MFKPRFFGTIKDGALRISRKYKAVFGAHLHRLEGKEVVITVEKVQSARTLKQNAYLWGVVYKIVSDETGFTPDEVHQVFGEKFRKYHKERQGNAFSFIQSTTEMTKVQISEYIENCIRYASTELGLVIPSPDEVEVYY